MKTGVKALVEVPLGDEGPASGSAAAAPPHQRRGRRSAPRGRAGRSSRPAAARPHPWPRSGGSAPASLMRRPRRSWCSRQPAGSGGRGNLRAAPAPPPSLATTSGRPDRAGAGAARVPRRAASAAGPAGRRRAARRAGQRGGSVESARHGLVRPHAPAGRRRGLINAGAARTAPHAAGRRAALRLPAPRPATVSGAARPAPRGRR